MGEEAAGQHRRPQVGLGAGLDHHLATEGGTGFGQQRPPEEDAAAELEAGDAAVEAADVVDGVFERRYLTNGELFEVVCLVYNLTHESGDAIPRVTLRNEQGEITLTPEQVASADMSIATSRSVSRLKKISINFLGSSDQEWKVYRYPGADFKIGARWSGFSKSKPWAPGSLKILKVVPRPLDWYCGGP